MHNKTIYQLYQRRFVFRVSVLIVLLLLYIFYPQTFSVIKPGGFFRSISLLHVFWVIWIWDMILQLIPLKGHLSLGSQKQFKVNYSRPFCGVDNGKLKQYRHSSNLGALKVMAVWLMITAVIGVLSFKKVLTEKELLLLTAGFYVCDLICVLYWCPFQKWIMKNRCCTTCRIYNWDSLMIFTPMLFIAGFYSLSLFFISLIVFVAWEIRVFKYPERFWDGANDALKCDHCTDKICGGKSSNKVLDVH